MPATVRDFCAFPARCAPGSVKAACAFAVAMLLGGCAVGPDFVRPPAPAENSYTKVDGPLTTVSANGVKQNISVGNSWNTDWWQLFKSAQLDDAVRRAVNNSPTLTASEVTLRQSQDSLRAGYGVFFPQVQGDLGGARERSAPIAEGSPIPGSVFNYVSAGFSISYVLDIFGGQRRAVEGLAAQRDYQLYASKAAYVTLTANVVNACIARAAYAAEIRATLETVKLERDQLDAIKAQLQAGTVSYSAVLTMQMQIAATEATLAPLRQRLDQTDHLLAMLEGSTPAAAVLPDIDIAKLTLPENLPLSLPSELVRQRPDVLQAEAQMHAASANVGVATAAMFPSFSLTGTFGVAGSSFGNLSPESNKFWSVGPAISVPLFRGGSLWYGRKAAEDLLEASQANYRQTVLTAFQQVADSINAIGHDAEGLQAASEARRAAMENLQLLQANLQAGVAADIDVLVADVQFHQADIAWQEAVAQRHQDTVALFVALGGGWWNTNLASAEGKAQ
jgi:NodT family efflux transporter outer membrane factor (OMF) lipoprotein